MNTGCEFYADALVDLARGALEAERAERVEAHVATCEECREALDAIRAVQNARVAVPEGLEARIQAAVRGRGGATIRERTSVRLKPRRPWRGWRPWALPLAAAAVLAVWFGASELLSPVGGPEESGAGTEVAEAGYDPYGTWPASDGVVAGSVVLSELSLEELEALLEEMQ